MRPLQLWLPSLQGSLAIPEVRRDRERAYRAWRGEQIVWLMTELSGTTHRWDHNGSPTLAVRSEQWEVLHVYHVGENGGVWGPQAAARFPNGSVKGLLNAWLNLRLDEIRFRPAPEEIRFPLPRFHAGRTDYEVVAHSLESRSLLPITRIDEESRTVWFQWPPEASDPLPVSPEAESAARYRFVAPDDSNAGPREQDAGEHPMTAMPNMVEWPEPFRLLFPALSGEDDLFARAQMIAIAEQSQDDLPGAVREARAVSDEVLSNAETTLRQGWLDPIIAAEGRAGALAAVETRFSLLALSLEDGLGSPAWQEELGHSMPIRRAWGVIGLCWALLLDRLESQRSFRHCERCARLIHGRSHKRFCSEEDNQACFRARRAENRRRERSRRPNRSSSGWTA